MAIIKLEQYLQANPDAVLQPLPDTLPTVQQQDPARSAPAAHNTSSRLDVDPVVPEIPFEPAEAAGAGLEPAADRTLPAAASTVERRKIGAQVLAGLGLTVLGLCVITPIARQAINSGWPEAARVNPDPRASAPAAPAPKSSGNHPVTKPSALPAAPASLRIPEAWGTCGKPELGMSIVANAGIRVPVKLSNGKQVPVAFQVQNNPASQPRNHQNVMLPQAKSSQIVEISACLPNSRPADVPAITRRGSQIIINRAAFVTEAAAQSGAGGTKGSNYLTVQGFDPKTKLSPNTQISPAEAARINAILQPGGSLNKAYGQTVSYELIDASLRQTSTQNGAAITEVLDAAELASLKSANPGVKLSATFTGQYPSLAVQWEVQNATLKPLSGIVLVQPNSSAVIVNGIGAGKT